MKIKKDYILKTVANQHIIVPIGEAAVKFQGMITLNDTGKYLFEVLKEDTTLEQLLMKLIESYEMDPKTAKKDVDKFIELLDKHNIIDK